MVLFSSKLSKTAECEVTFPMRWREGQFEGRNRSSARDEIQLTSVDITHRHWWEQGNMRESCQGCLFFPASSWKRCSNTFRLLYHLTLDVAARGCALYCSSSISWKTCIGWKLREKKNKKRQPPSLSHSITHFLCLHVFFSPHHNLSAQCLPVSSFLSASQSFWPPHPCRISTHSTNKSDSSVLFLTSSLSLWLFFSV